MAANRVQSMFNTPAVLEDPGEEKETGSEPAGRDLTGSDVAWRPTSTIKCFIKYFNLQ